MRLKPSLTSIVLLLCLLAPATANAQTLQTQIEVEAKLWFQRLLKPTEDHGVWIAVLFGGLAYFVFAWLTVKRWRRTHGE